MSGSISATVIRATRLDADGAAATGANAYIVSEGFVRITATPRYTESPSTVILDIWGDVVVNEPENPEMLGVELQVGLIGVDPALVAFLAEGCTRIDDSVPVGLRLRAGRDTTARYALETWTDALEGPDDCFGTQWHHWAFTRVRAGVLSAWTFEDASLEFTVTGYTQPALASWGDGPHDPAPGEAVTVGDFAVHSLTLVPPPEPTNGLASL